MVNVSTLGANSSACIQNFQTSDQAKKLENTKLKDFSFEDLIELSTAYENTPVMGSPLFNLTQLPKDFSEEDIAKMMETGTLPEGYLMAYTPKTIVHNYVDGMYRGDTVKPPTYTLVKDTPFCKSLSGTTTFSNEIPEGFKVMKNFKGKTYIVPNKETQETLDNKTKNIFDRIFAGFKKENN